MSETFYRVIGLDRHGEYLRVGALDIDAAPYAVFSETDRARPYADALAFMATTHTGYDFEDGRWLPVIIKAFRLDQCRANGTRTTVEGSWHFDQSGQPTD